ncbi:unnamed protein product [Auanema sp. JU1783]|nr:unnamed protein product [Auanema sp. JU1783]
MFSNDDPIIVNELILIQYPGIIKNLEKGLETMGGLAQMSQNHFSGRTIELRHTPDNPYTSCLIADRKMDSKITSGTLRLVLKVRRKKKNPNHVESHCLGLVTMVYDFDSMCDFQYLPVKKRLNTDIYEDLIPRLIPTDLPSALCWWERQDKTPGYTQLFLPPYQFSRYTTPSSKILHRETDLSVDKTKKKIGHGQNLRVERKALSINVHAEDDFPKEPTEDAINDANFRCKNEEPHKILERIFSERPMWTRVAIQYKSSLDDNLIKSLLQKYAFYIASGPWGRLWCKFGYDPRTDPLAKRYQSLMVTFRQHTKIPERQRLKVSTERSGFSEIEPINYVYQPGKLPRVRQMWYSLCDIELPLTELLLKKDYSNASDVGTKGWINSEALEELRELVKEDVQKTSKELDIVEDQELSDDM